MPYQYAAVEAGDRIRYRTAGIQVRAEGGVVIGSTITGTEGVVIGHGAGRLAHAGWRLTRPDTYLPEGAAEPAPAPERATCLLHPINFEAL